MSHDCSPISLEEFRHQFQALQSQAWLDTPGAPPGAKPVIDACREFLLQWETGRFDWQEWDSRAYSVRGLFGRYAGVDSACVALVDSVAAAATTVARSARVQRIVVSDAEFRSNLLPWLEAAEQRRIELVRLRADDGFSRTEDYISAVSEETLIAVSSVTSAVGNRVDIEAIARACRAHGARLFLNLTQSLGVLRYDHAAVDADYVATHGYKWLLGPRGCAWLYVRPDRLTELKPLAAGWRTATKVPQGYFGGHTAAADDASRLDGAVAWLPCIGAAAALRLMLRLPGPEVEKHVLALAEHLRGGLAEHGNRTAPVEGMSHIVAVRTEDPDADISKLRAAGVVASAQPRGVRFGIHAFNTDRDIERALDALKSRRRVSG